MVALAAFGVGLVLGGLLSASVLWLLSGLASPLPPPARYLTVLGFALVAVLRDAGIVRFRLPQNARQVPREVLRRPVRGALRFGFELGTGVRTYLSATAPYAVAVALLLLTPQPLDAVLAGAGFGLGRAATPLIRFASGAGEEWDAKLRSRLPLLTVGGGAVVAGLLAAAVIGLG